MTDGEIVRQLWDFHEKGGDLDGSMQMLGAFSVLRLTSMMGMMNKGRAAQGEQEAQPHQEAQAEVKTDTRIKGGSCFRLIYTLKKQKKQYKKARKDIYISRII